MTLTLSMADTLINNSQETDYTYDHHPEEDNAPIDLSLLRINSFNNSSDRRRANSSPPQFPSHGSFSSSSAAATSPVKRPSPEPREADEPRRKKLFPSPPETKEDEEMSNRLGYKKVPLPADCNPARIRSSPVYNRSLSDRFASTGYTRGGVGQETAPSGNIVSSLPPRPRKPVFRRSVSDLSPAPSRYTAIDEADLANQETSEANKMLYVIKDGVRELDQWCNKLLHYSEAVKQDDTPKEEVEPQEEEQEKECKEGVKVDRVGEAFVVEINCPCGRNYRTLFSGRDCYYKLL
ncbi:hypothetical protein HID58_059392 [Brassica napus]|uniref:BnaC04g12560D protein n=4 Tax=Brassica TaxID=3705 RepID=A0A078FG54_BRANA|nr:uncharacterized protein BNAC04G12560D [Brassica napus]KAH0883296.1 hypothetical protein HID58_059392 [Brassica napus]CAF1823467.1 unnamed protein product [Brassica napus]CDY12226.1 BnaC04g12560D [Brassica napus]